MINMKKEYRQELTILRQAKRKVQKDLTAAEKAAARDVRAIQLAVTRGRKRVGKELARIERRESILQGRLS